MAILGDALLFLQQPEVAFEFCQPFIALDGCHTKARF
jgi:hypothetical protein